MFDLIDEDVFADDVSDFFSVLDVSYVTDICKELLPRLQATFDQAYETRFVIVEIETGKPMNANALLKTRDAAEDFLKIVGDDKYAIGLLLTER